MSYEQILVERQGGVSVLTMNRPEKLNARTEQMARELREAIEAANEDGEVAAIVLTGAGRAFCAGQDIGGWQRDLQAGSASAAGRAQPGSASAAGWVQLLQRSKPLIAAVNGVAVGVGLTQILPADIRVANTKAQFGAIFARMGVVPELASTYFLSQLIGLGAALDLSLTARMIDATEALRLGLVSKVVEPEQLLPEALAIGETIAALPGPQVRMIKQLFARNAAEQDVAAVISRETEALEAAYATPHFREAVTAFMEKRQPSYRGLQSGPV